MKEKYITKIIIYHYALFFHVAKDIMLNNEPQSVYECQNGKNHLKLK